MRISGRGDPFTVVQRENLPKQSPVVVLLRAHDAPRTIVMVDPQRAHPKDLAAAFHLVDRLRTKFGDTLSRDIQAVPKAATNGKPESSDSPELTHMSHYLSALGTAKSVAIKHLGVGRRITVVRPLPKKVQQ